MSIALPTLLVVAAIIPGIAFLNAYYAGKIPRQLTGLSPLTELALYFFWAIPIDAVALRVAGASLSWSVLEATLPTSGPIARAAVQRLLLAPITGTGWWNVVFTYVLVVILAAASGAVLRRLVWALRLDARIPALRLQAEWYYTLLGRRPSLLSRVIPQVDVLVEQPGTSGTRLFVGVVAAFDVSKEGGIEELYLQAAQRHRRREGGGTDIVDIPGDLLSIKGSTILSTNMRYYEIPAPTGFWPRLGARVSNFLSSLLRDP
jgi:hypothetical protein